MSESGREGVLHIRKYSNRRYYDTTRSRHVTLQDVRDLICSGEDVRITDSQTDGDITNVVLIQMMVEKDQPKLDLFPSSILHQMIRSDRELLRSSLERFFGSFLEAMSAMQKQFDVHVREAKRRQMVPPLGRANGVRQMLSPSQQEVPAGHAWPEASRPGERRGEQAPENL